MQLVIAEKPSVGMSIAKVLKANEKKDGYVQGSGFIVSWCVGHLVTLANADEYDSSYKIWCRDDLPIIPKKWKYTIIEQTRKQFDILEELMHRANVSEIICATDAGREGELIFRLVYMKAQCNKPFRRLWLSSMEEKAIMKAFADLRPGSDYDNLYMAASCRQKADWIVGISGTRLFSVVYQKNLPVGRVMTPTLAIIMQRTEEIERFEAEKFYTVVISTGFQSTSCRISSKEKADEIKNNCNGMYAEVIDFKSTEKSTAPPKLFDLTTLQRVCNRYYGYTAQQVLDVAQKLYEKKLLTYPRTDSCYITDDTASEIPKLVKGVSFLFPEFDSSRAEIGRIVDNTKVSDHHALLPTILLTAETLSSLDDKERKVISCVVMRLLCAISSNETYESREVTLSCAGEKFTASSKSVINDGWKAVEKAFLRNIRKKGEVPETGENCIIPDLKIGENLRQDASPSIREGVTTPPKAYTEDTLLSAMEHASAEDFSRLEGVERTGLGTPATRAGVIEKLVKLEFVVRKGKQILITQKGRSLIGIVPDQLKSASLTVQWEKSLNDIAKGVLSPDIFLEAIAVHMRSLVSTYRKIDLEESAFESHEIIGACPRCCSPVIVHSKGYFCRNRECSFKLWKNDMFFTSRKKELTKSIAIALLKHGKAIVRKLWSETKQKEYDAVVIMDASGEDRVRFKLSFDDPVLRTLSSLREEDEKAPRRKERKTRRRKR